MAKMTPQKSQACYGFGEPGEGVWWGRVYEAMFGTVPPSCTSTVGPRPHFLLRQTPVGTGDGGAPQLGQACRSPHRVAGKRRDQALHCHHPGGMSNLPLAWVSSPRPLSPCPSGPWHIPTMHQPKPMPSQGHSDTERGGAAWKLGLWSRSPA